MLWRYVKVQLFILLFFGVGPALVIIYFLEGQSSDSTALYWGVPLTVLAFGIPPVLIFYAKKWAAERAAFEQRGVLGLAEITGVKESWTTVNDEALVKLQLHISGSGFEPFDTRDKVLPEVTRLPSITARKLVVVVDPTTQKHKIDWERSAWVNGVVPAKFTVAEDDKEYDLTGQAGPLMEILQILKTNNVQLNELRSNPAARQQVLAVLRRVPNL